MDEWLDERGLYRKNNALDGTCLFRAVAEQLHPCDPISGHLTVRRRCVRFMMKNRELFEDRISVPFDEYIAEMALPKTWAGPTELDAISLFYEVDFEVFNGPEPPIEVTKNGFDRILYLNVAGNMFYDAVYPKALVQTFGFCQAIIYKILYEQVFKLDDLDYAVEKMLHDKAARAQRERYLNKKSIYTDDNDDSYLEHVENPVNVRQILDKGAILFPYKVAKALDPDIYRNIDFDNWVETNRGKPVNTPCLCKVPVARRSNFWYGSAGTLRLGAKCHVRMEDRILTGHIQKLSPNLGPVIVFIEEIGQKKTVNFDDLIAMPRASMKPEWNYSHKHQMISKLGRKKGDESPDVTRRRIKPMKSKCDCDNEESEENFNERICDERSCAQSEAISAGSAIKCSSLNSPPLTKCLVFSPCNESSVINTMAVPSSKSDYSDLPLNDLETLRFFYNLGIQYFKQGIFTLGSPMPMLLPSDERMRSHNIQSPTMMSTGQLVQGSPLIQTSHPPTPPVQVQVCQGAPLVAPLPPVPAVLPPPVQVSPPTPAVAPVPLPPVQQETPHRENRDRVRYPKYNLPPRFQRLEKAEKENCESTIVPPTEEIQHPEISSTAPPIVECPIIPYAMSSPPMQYTCQPMVSYYYPAMEDGETYIEAYTDNVGYTEAHLVEGHAIIETPEIAYPMSYPIYPTMPMYYPMS